mgnify:CR=1 FL=1
MLGVLAVGALPAMAAELDRWQVSVSTDRLAWLASVAWMGSKAQSADVLWRPPVLERDDIEIGLTGRILDTSMLVDGAAGEVGLRLAYAPMGVVYRPSAGLETGWSGGARFDWADYFGAGWEEQDPVARADYAPFFVGVVCEPLRFSVGRMSVSTLGLSVGQMGRGRVVRARASLLSVGAGF